MGHGKSSSSVGIRLYTFIFHKFPKVFPSGFATLDISAFLFLLFLFLLLLHFSFCCILDPESLNLYLSIFIPQNTVLLLNLQLL